MIIKEDKILWITPLTSNISLCRRWKQIFWTCELPVKFYFSILMSLWIKFQRSRKICVVFWLCINECLNTHGELSHFGIVSLRHCTEYTDCCDCNYSLRSSINCHYGLCRAAYTFQVRWAGLRVCRTCCLEPPSRSHSSLVYTCNLQKTFENVFILWSF